MDLVICNTPLQVLQIENLIKSGVIKENNFHLLFFVYEETKKLDYYYDRLDKLSHSSFYFKHSKFPSYIFKLKSIFNKKKYNNVYIASVDNKIIHYILTFIDFKYLFSIDDGTANIFKSSSYYITRKYIVSRIVHFIFRCGFNLESTKEKIKQHYTIYPNMSNIVENTKHNDLLSYWNKLNKETKNKKQINLFLGTVYNEITNDKEKLILALDNLFKTSEFYYITHPRDNRHYFNNVLYIDEIKASEEIIIDLFEQYEFINIYGFNSSVQFNLMSISGVKNYNLVSTLMKNKIKIPEYSFIELNLDKYL